VYEVTKLLATSTRPRECFTAVLQLLADFLELRDAGIALQSEAAEPELIGLEPTSREAARRREALIAAALERTRHTGMPWVVESEWCEPAFESAVAKHPEMGELEASFIAVPIKGCGRVIGVLCVERAHGPADQACFCFDEDVRLLTVIAHAIAQASRVIPRASSAAPPPPPSGRTSGGRASSMAGSSARWRATLDRARIAARTSATVLLRGESGTGKEVLARYIHEMSPRASRPFVTLNCAALAESVLESELFGHEKGAFTGATAQRKGRFELADGGTLFLDEIGEISGSFQARLLRVLQLGEFERVGGTSTLKVDVRLVAATNRNLEQDVRSGRFRADLYYRVSVVPLLLPALRERASDIPELATEFLVRFNEVNGTDLIFEPSALAALARYSFPGNVRELENVVRRAASFAQGDTLTARDFAWLEEDTPLTLAMKDAKSAPASWHRAAPASAKPAAAVVASSEPGPYKQRDLEARDQLIAALEQTGWVQAKAARLLGLTPRQIAYALQKYRIPVRKF
jgi:Nif-specific regulatory protein